MGAGARLEAASAADPALVSLCQRETGPVAVADAAGIIVCSSPLFDVLLRQHAEVAPAVAASVGLASSQRRTYLELRKVVLELAPLEGTLLVRVRAYGPGVVQARMNELPGGTLSAREGECLAVALEGRSNAVIALRIGVRPETVKVHLRNAYRKLGATGRTPLLARLVPGS